ncbi:MAG: response regulator [Vicinamibacteria bacterium]
MTTVLVVDDTEASRYALGRTLAKAGFLVWEAATGTEALGRAHDCPDAILLDIKLPDITGLEVCRRLKANPATAAIPVLQMTATFGGTETQVAALEGGADAYLTHPVEPIVLVATIRSLLRAREAETRSRRLTAWWQSTFDAIQDGVMLLSRSGQVLRCNRAMAEMLGRSPEQIVADAGLPVFGDGVLPSEDWPLTRALSERRRIARDLQVGSRWFEIVADPVLDESVEVSAVVTTVKDITDRRAADAKLEALLASEQSARQEAEQVNRVKDEFLATLSHELRTPLNAIVGWTHILKTGPLDAVRTQQAIDTIARNAHLQAQLISDILDVSRIIAGKLRLELRPVDMADVVQSALETVRPAAEAKGIRIDCVLDPAAGPLTGDGARLQQVAWNLLSNAIKFTPRGGRVGVRIERVNSSTRLTVEDNGPGVAPDFLPHVFERFRQGDSSSTRPYGGLGLGLAIVRHLVELHGGIVDAANRTDGSGAIFRVTLPSPALFAAAFEAQPETEVRAEERSWTPSGRPLAGVSVLVVDDDEDARNLLQFVLERSGAVVITVASAAEAVVALRERRPDALLADIEMPGEDGYSLMAKVRALPAEEGGAVPAAALTAYAGAQDRLRALQAGYQHHVAKPVSPADVTLAVVTLLGLAPPRS